MIRTGLLWPGREIDEEALSAADIAGNDSVNDFGTGPWLHFEDLVGPVPSAGKRLPSNRECLLPTVWDISVSRTRARPADVDSAAGVSSCLRSAWGTREVGLLDTVWSSELSATDGEAYDRFVATARGGHFSQTRAWAKVATAAKPFDARCFLARRDGRVAGAALILRTQAFGLMALPFAQVERGPVCDDPEQMPDVLGALLEQSRRHGIVRISVMPYWAGEAKPRVERLLKQRGFADVQSFRGRHARSLRLDLASLPADDPFAGSALAQVRHEIRRAERAGATARRGQEPDFIAFREMHKQLLRLEGKQPRAAVWYEALAEYYLPCEERGAMFVCEHEGNVVSAIFVARHGALATYVMGASSASELRFPKMVLPMANAITWAKENGVEVLDLGGIPMEGDRDAKRASIAHFKRGFSRTEITFVHEHVRWF